MTEKGVLIIGAGQAGSQTATSLRQDGFEGAITIVGDEPYLPYQRPPLSKAYLKGELEESRLYFKPAEWFETQNIDILTDCTVTDVNVETNIAKTSDGKTLNFDYLVFATGSRNRQLPLEGAQLENVFGLRSLKDVDDLRPHVTEGKNLIIIGAGYIGLETAAAANALGMKVTVLELADRVLARVTSPAISAFYSDLHTSHGVNIKTDTSAVAINGKDGKVASVTLSTGETLSCDALLIGIGILPNIELAVDAGITCEDGIVVDHDARTNIVHVYAAGDCAKRNILPYGRTGRLESVHNAIEQGKQIAAAILSKPTPKLDCPWFWSDQYDVKLQIAGLSTGYDNFIVRGSIDDKKFAVFYFKDDVLIAVDAINSPPEFMIAKRLILTKAKVSPEELSDTQQSLKEIAAAFKK